jgi:hypothetical protein
MLCVVTNGEAYTKPVNRKKEMLLNRGLPFKIQNYYQIWFQSGQLLKLVSVFMGRRRCEGKTNAQRKLYVNQLEII